MCAHTLEPERESEKKGEEVHIGSLLAYCQELRLKGVSTTPVWQLISSGWETRIWAADTPH